MDPKQILIERFGAAVAAAFGDEHAATDPLVGPSQNPKFGDYQANLAMKLGKKLASPEGSEQGGKSKPRDVASKIVEHLKIDDVAETPEIAGPGFINIRLKNDWLAAQADALCDDERLGIPCASPPRKIVVDYSSPNVAKEMHVGHLRSTIIGDALVRTLELLGHEVVRQNHLGDWGTQFGMLIEHLTDGGGDVDAGIADLNQFYKAAKKRFDTDDGFKERARQRVVALQSGDEETRALWNKLIAESKRHFEHAYARLGVSLTDGDICGESFYNDRLETVVSELLEKGIARESEGAICVFVPGFTNKEKEPVPLIVRKSDGGFGYAATDLAALRYRTTELKAHRAFYVVDARQADHFKQVYWTAQQAGWWPEDGAEHVAFGMILGEDNKPLKTREGDPEKLANLLDRAVGEAGKIAGEKQADLSEEERREVSEAVGIAVVKYGDLSNDRARNYTFSWERMLAFEGNTAPYMQMQYTRVRSIFRKGDIPPEGEKGGPVSIVEDQERALIIKLLQLPSAIDAVVAEQKPHHLCTYLYDLAGAFSSFHKSCMVLKAETDALRESRIRLCSLTARALERGLSLLGITVTERM